MGIDYTADIGYGFMIPDSIKFEDVEDLLVKNKRLKLIWHGDAYTGDMVHVISIKDSQSDSWAHAEIEPIKPNKMIIKDDWNDVLKSFAKEIGLDKPKIGWYLCSSVS